VKANKKTSWKPSVKCLRGSVSKLSTTTATELLRAVLELNWGSQRCRRGRGNGGVELRLCASLLVRGQDSCHCENRQRLLLTDKREKKYEALLKARADGALKKPQLGKLS